MLITTKELLLPGTLFYRSTNADLNCLFRIHVPEFTIFRETSNSLSSMNRSSGDPMGNNTKAVLLFIQVMGMEKTNEWSLPAVL